MARKEALDYCRRCLAVMLCCVLVFSLTVRVTPRAKAVVGEATAALAVGSGSFAAAPVAGVLGACALVVAGVDIGAGYVHAEDSVFYGTRGYNIGAACWDYLYGLGGDIADWCMSTENFFKNKGGVSPGDSFTIPAQYAALIQQWVVDNYDFTDGIVSYDDYLLFNNGNAFVLTDVDTAPFDSATSSRYLTVPVKGVGSLIGFDAQSFESSYEVRHDIADGIYFMNVYILTEPPEGSDKWTYVASTQCWFPGATAGINAGFGLSGYSYTGKASVIQSMENNTSDLVSYGVLFYSSAINRLYCGTFYSSTREVMAGPRNYYDLSVAQTPASIDTTLTKTPALDVPIEKEQTVTIPAGVSTTMVDGLSVPIMGEMTASGLTQGKEDEENPPGTVTAPWDRVLEGLESIDTKVGSLSGSIADAVSGTMATAISTTMASVISQAQAQQVAVEGAMADPDDLGAVFISKFPFSIPWDVVKAIKLLAAPPVTPHWEVDFMQPIAGRVGGFQGSTTIVIDFGEYPIVGIATRWFSTLMFVYALASGTKKLIWTA